MRRSATPGTPSGTMSPLTTRCPCSTRYRIACRPAFPLPPVKNTRTRKRTHRLTVGEGGATGASAIIDVVTSSAFANGVSMPELLATLSLGTDLGMGHPMEHVLRQTSLALRLAEEIGLSDGDREVVYFSSMMAWVGCHIGTFEQAKWFGDDCAVKHDIRSVDFGRPVESAAFVIRHIGSGRRVVERALLGAAFLGEGVKAMDAIWRTSARRGSAGRATGARRRCSGQSRADLRALGWQGRSWRRRGLRDPGSVPARESRRCSRGVLPSRRSRCRSWSRQGATRNPVRP